MIVFSAIGGFCDNSVILPDGDVALYTDHSDLLKKDFVYMLFLRKESDSFYYRSQSKGVLIPLLSRYEALPYKRQPLSDQLDLYTLRSKIKRLGVPLSSDYVALDKIKSFYMNCKRYYALVAYGSGSLSDAEENGEVALITFDSYSEAICTLRYNPEGKIRNILKGDFRFYNGWYPYVRVDYMNRPISLLGDISSHVGCHSLGKLWCYYLVCFLKNGSVARNSLVEYFDFIHRDKFSRIIHYSG